MEKETGSVQLTRPFATRPSALLTTGGGRLPPWLSRLLEPQALVGTRAEAGWTLACCLLAAAIGAVDVLTGARPIGAGALMVLTVVLASWVVGRRQLGVVVAVTVAVATAEVTLGILTPVTFAARTVVVVVVALVGHAAAARTAEVRRARRHEMSTLLRASELLGGSLDQSAVAAEVVQVAAGALAPGEGPGQPATALVRVDGGRAFVAARHDASGTAVRPAAGGPLAEVPPRARDALAGGRPVVTSSADVAAALQLPAEARAWALAPVQVDGRPYGLLAVAASDPALFRRDALRLLEGVARFAGQALSASLRHAEVDSLRQRLQHSMDLALDVGRSLSADQVIASILVRVTDTVGADQATLARVDGADLVVEAVYRGAPDGVPTRVGRHYPRETVAGVPDLDSALAMGQPVIGGEPRARVGGEDLAAALPDSPHVLTFPFVFGGRTACLLVLGRTDRTFGADDLAQLEPMADVALLALRNAHLYEEAEAARREAGVSSGRLRAAIQAAEEIGTGELPEVMDRVLGRAMAVVQADQGGIFRLDGEALVLEHVQESGDAEVAPAPPPTPRDSRLAADAIGARRPLRGVLPGGAGHVIQCPLVLEREIVGLLELTRRRDDPFEEADLLALQPFATLAALLLRNARLLAEARQVGRAKSAFLNLAAHELRTPLAVIKGYLSLLDDGTYAVPEETRAEAVGTLLAKAQELDSLVEALLTTARLEVGSLPRAAGELDVCQAVQDAAARLRPRARLEGARIEVRLPEEDVRTRADRAHVARILDNLLNNALTYSPRAARITMEVRAGDPIQVVVRDRGQGIPPEHHERVFERFHRVEGSTSRYSPGLGLGLAISRELAQMNGGTLVLEESKPDVGSVFVLRLPLVTTPAAASA
jgi:signal transduction histidine kinase